MASADTMLSRAPGDYPVVLFDFDGTLADTIPLILRVAGEVLARHGFEVPHEKMLLMIGPPLEEGFQLLAGVPREEALAYADEYRELFDSILVPDAAHDLAPVLPGIPELLNALVSQGKRLAIATSRMEYTALRMTELLGLTQFEAVIGRVFDLRYTKAESIQGALEALGVDAADAIMVGDRMHDVEGAAEHGMPCIGVYTGAAAPGELEGAGAALVAHGTEELAELFGIASA